jgi:hypothetical protein
VDANRTIGILRGRIAEFGERECYLVYPSWQFRFSCNIVLRDQEFIIEGKYGSQKGLASGMSRPDFGLRVPFGFRSKMTVYVGAPTEEVRDWIGEILLWCKRVPGECFYAEVALTHAFRLVFYELFRT